MALFIYPKYKYQGGLEKEMGFRGNVTWSKMLNFSYMFIYFHSSALYPPHLWVSACCLYYLAQLRYIQALEQGLESISVF